MATEACYVEHQGQCRRHGEVGGLNRLTSHIGRNCTLYERSVDNENVLFEISLKGNLHNQVNLRTRKICHVESEKLMQFQDH